MKDALHLPGGNRFDDMRINLPAAYRDQDAKLATLARKSVRRGVVSNTARLADFAAARRLKLHDMRVDTGLSRGWFDPFADYWVYTLGGRPVTLTEFHSLRFQYRMRNQKMTDFTWDNDAAHIDNWQRPENITFTMQLLYRQALNPVRWRGLWRHIKPGMRVLEYGCALAPMYATWRSFLSHRNVTWTLADIQNFPFHYARHLYGADLEAELVSIPTDRLDSPLDDRHTGYDVIFIQEVFEHLHEPRHIATYLLDRLKPKGLLVFDYISSEASGLDTPSGLAQRLPTLALLADRLEIIEGRFEVSQKSLGLCIGRLK